MASTTPEGKVKKKVISILKFHKAWYCSPATRGMGRSGVMDILCCLRGVFIGIEVKRDAKHLPTKLQEHELWKLQQCGGWGIVIHADNLLDLEGLCSAIVAQAELTRASGHAKLDAAEAEAAHDAEMDAEGADRGEPPEQYGWCAQCESETRQNDGGQCVVCAGSRHQPKPDTTIN